MPLTELKQTPFFRFHQDHGAQFVDFAGWRMPMLFRSIHEEHHDVRARGGMFDVSHMGRIKLSGLHARRLLERTLTRRVSDMSVQRCRYSLVCNEQGGILDDVVVYRFDEHWLIVCNALNRERILHHFQCHIGNWKVKIEDQTESTAMVALQGPQVIPMIGRFSTEVPTLKRYAFCQKNLMILKMTISRTGYTGEDGVEVIMNTSMASTAIKLIYKENPDPNESQMTLAGLGARDTLRLEAGMPLYGHELDENTDPISAGLDFAVSLDKDSYENSEPFIGQDVLKRITAEGPGRRLVGLKLEGQRTARQHMTVHRNDEPVGSITSGCLSPTLGYPIAMAYVEAAAAEIGTTLNIDLGRHAVDAHVVERPFYRRPSTPDG